MRLDEMEIRRVSGGGFRLDGGSMFGVVPKVLWEKENPADERNRIPLETNCTLVQTTTATILIDTGYGSKATEKERERQALARGNPLVENLAQAGVAAEGVDFVVLTHLHFDHVGGCTFRDPEGVLRPTFPNARHIVQQREWEDALGNIPELRGAYFSEELQVLGDAGLIQTVQGHHLIADGVAVEPTGGHTRGHQVVQLGGTNDQAIYISELCPLTAHLRVFWTMAFDQDLLELRRAKLKFLEQASSGRWLVLFNHDPRVTAARIQRTSSTEFAVAEVVSL